ncbi:MAG: hypothetical protein KGI08_10975 [Thaumarchaeota archaeon]|nr:hypothetical protein [Nitrososphaerota archaeon]
MKDRHCSKCGKNWTDATFLSETFNYEGGNMVFECKCGNTESRAFLPTDIMSIEETMRYLMIQEGMDEKLIDLAMQHYRTNKSLNQLKK